MNSTLPMCDCGGLTSPCIRLASRRKFCPSTAAAGAPSYAYEFAWSSGIEGLGACHVLDVPFVFDALAGARTLTGPNPPQPLADEIHSAWVAFAESGDPGWARFEEDSRFVQIFDSPESGVVSDPRGDELAALRKSVA